LTSFSTSSALTVYGLGLFQKWGICSLRKRTCEMMWLRDASAFTCL